MFSNRTNAQLLIAGFAFIVLGAFIMLHVHVIGGLIFVGIGVVAWFLSFPDIL